LAPALWAQGICDCDPNVEYGNGGDLVSGHFLCIHARTCPTYGRGACWSDLVLKECLMYNHRAQGMRPERLSGCEEGAAHG